MKKTIIITFLLLQSTALFAQNFYYVDKVTGIRERLFWLVTPLGTDGRYMTDKNYQQPAMSPNIKYKGDPIKQKITLITLPNKQKANLTQKNNAITLTFSDGNQKIFKEATHWVDTTNKPVVDYISQYNGSEKDGYSYTFCIRAFGNKTEVKMVMLESDNINNKYVLTIPNKKGKYTLEQLNIESILYFQLTSPNGKAQLFKVEY